VVAEGVGKSQALATKIQEITGIASRATILGHLQRGGAPTAIDRVHGSNMGNIATDLLIKGEKNVIIVVKDGKYDHINIESALEYTREFDMEMYKRVRNLSI